ncbi:methyltransferase domain-containing protein [Nocardioides litoris]|uniref:methyltransferase domain-containing protein n=1 Tax=Nocardioides litoris TaxID=1926648 RepID=UPI00111EC6CE|nr:class I SAM-dependent methyltransferase [Nocardioides litoris]
MTDAHPASAHAPDWVARFFDAKALAHGPSGVLDHHRERAAAVERFGGLGRGRVLELGAGAGGSAAATADLGHDVVAVELSPRRAAYARALAEARPRLQVVEADFLSWSGDGEFGAVVLWNGFGVGSDEDQRVLLRRIASWLAPGGVALLDVFCPAGWIADAGLEEVEEETGLRERVDYDHLRSRFVDTWWFDGPDDPPLAQSARCYTVADLRLLLEGTGLGLEAVELDGRPADPDEGDAAAWAAAWSYRVRLRPR